jgi:glycerate dehydrogenase
MRIVVLDGYTLNPGDNPWTEVEKLGECTVHDRTPEDLTIPRAREAEIVLTNKTRLTAQTLAQLPKLRYIGVLATGYNVVDVAAARQRGIPVSNISAYGTDSVAQFVFALLLEMCHHVGHHDRLVRGGRWSESVDYCFWDTPQVELAGLKMGIVGFGRIGRRTGELAHAFGMEVLAHTRTPGQPPDYRPFAWKTLEEIFAESDVISLHCPQTATNVGMVNRPLLERMKPSAMLINTARGALVNEADLAAALNEGRIAAAAADVVSVEPIDPKNPLLTARNCLLTPHMAWGTLAARRRLMAATAQNIRAFQAGKPINVVNQ